MTLEHDSFTWMASRLRIATKAGELTSLIPNFDQMRVLSAWAAQEAAGLPVRLIILKYRQGGFSTIIYWWS